MKRPQIAHDYQPAARPDVIRYRKEAFAKCRRNITTLSTTERRCVVNEHIATKQEQSCAASTLLSTNICRHTGNEPPSVSRGLHYGISSVIRHPDQRRRRARRMFTADGPARSNCITPTNGSFVTRKKSRVPPSADRGLVKRRIERGNQRSSITAGFEFADNFFRLSSSFQPANPFPFCL